MAGFVIIIPQELEKIADRVLIGFLKSFTAPSPSFAPGRKETGRYSFDLQEGRPHKN